MQTQHIGKLIVNLILIQWTHRNQIFERHILVITAVINLLLEFFVIKVQISWLQSPSTSNIDWLVSISRLALCVKIEMISIFVLSICPRSTLERFLCQIRTILFIFKIQRSISLGQILGFVIKSSSGLRSHDISSYVVLKGFAFQT